MKKLKCAILSAVVACPTVALAQTHHVVPLGYENTEGPSVFLGPYTSGPRSYQMLIHEDQVADLVGHELTGISWRLPGSATVNWPESDATFDDYDIYLGPSVAPEDRSFVFEENVAGPQDLVRSGALVVPAGALAATSSPNIFSFEIEYDVPWLYAGGHLLVEIRHTGNDVGTRSVDAVGTSPALGYGDQFSALWQGTYTPTEGLQGNFTVARFTSVETVPKCAGPADLNCDGSVGVADLLILLSEWGPCADCDDCPADLSDDCAVGVADLLILLSKWE